MLYSLLFKGYTLNLRKEMKIAIIYMLFASLLFTIMGGVVKTLSKSIPSLELVFFRSFFSVLFIVILIIKKPIKQKGGRLKLLAFRGFLGLLGLIAFFYNIVNIPLAEAMTFSRTSPIFTAIFASIFISEKQVKRLGFIFLLDLLE